MNEDQFSGLLAVLERIANALEGKPRPVNLHSGPRHLGQHGQECIVCHPVVVERTQDQTVTSPDAPPITFIGWRPKA